MKNFFITCLTLFVPFCLLTMAVWIVAHPWFIAFEYTRIVFPQDMSLEKRTQLALIGLHSVMPAGDETELTQARLPSGKPAFNEREIKHMADVRVLVRNLYIAFLVGLVATIIAAGMLARKKNFDYVLLGLKRGALLTIIGLFCAAAAMVFVNFDTFFLYLHYLFFKDDSFLFDEGDTLMRIYPEQFWSDACLLVGLLCLVAALILWYGANRVLKKSKA